VKAPAKPVLLKAGLLAAATLLAWLAFTAAAVLVYGPAAWTPLINGAPPWRGLGVALLLAACVAGAGWWRLGARLHPRAPELGGVVKIGVMVCAVPMGLLGGVLLFLAPWAISAHEEASAYGFEVTRGPRSIVAVGAIGPGFAAALDAALSAEPAVRVIEITSEGGIADEAMAAGRLIEAAKATVVAREQCDSACLVVLMAGVRRFADADLEIGFHAGAALGVGSPKVVDHMVAIADAEVDAYLLKRGAPRAAIDAARRLGPEDIHYVPAAELERQGVLRTLAPEAGAPQVPQRRTESGR
jgi:hypothetical protein